MMRPAFSLALRLLGRFTVFGAVVAAWCATLWLLIAPDFSRWSLPQLALVHAGPPLLAWGVWRWWRQRRRQRKAAQAIRKEELAAQERLAALETARVQHAAEQQRLHFGCDCRALAVAQVVTATPAEEPLFAAGDAIHFSSLAGGELEAASGLLDQLRPGIEEALDALYIRCSAAAHFPIYVAPPSEVVGDEVVAIVRQVRARFLADSRAAEAPVLFLPVRDSAADSVVGLFETTPDLPGAVVLAFDSPWWRANRLVASAWDEPGSDDAQRAEQQRWLGAPGQGTFALFLTHPEFDHMLASLTRRQSPHDAMTPYWEKDDGASHTHPVLAGLSDAAYQVLQEQPPLARIHRAALASFDAGSPLRHDLALSVEALIERAQIHAAQIDLACELPPAADGSTDSPPPAEPAAARCDWLIHNSGSVDCGGPRLASLGVALFRRGLDLDPIEAATNVVVKGGDFGQARGVAMLALCAARVMDGEGAALCAEFLGEEGLALFFAQAPGAPA